MIKNIRHTGITVNSLEDSLFFYQNLLGFKIIYHAREQRGAYIDTLSALKEVDVEIVKLTSLDNQMIELLKYHSHPKKQTRKYLCNIGISHIAFTVENINKLYKLLLKHNIEFNFPPQLSLDNQVKVAFCRAPEGTFIELVEVI